MNTATTTPATLTGKQIAAQAKALRTQRTHEAFTAAGVFWAFSDEQFEAGQARTQLAEGDTLVSIGAGGYLPNSKVDGLKATLKAIDREHARTMYAHKAAREAHIANELMNHEATHTGDVTDTMEALGKGYTRAEVLKVYATLCRAEG